VGLPLHDIDDAAGFVGAVIRRSGIKLGHEDREDLHQHLLIAAWQLSLKYDPDRGSFSSLAGTALRRKIVDWQRQRYGRRTWKFKNRVHERRLPELVSLDDPEHDRLGTAVAGSVLDDGALSFPDQLRALDARACRPGW
jgi:DNA-directed RNA polymerase specialized sigma24 family protein